MSAFVIAAAAAPVVPSVTVAVPGTAELGECPIWSARRERLIWVDTFAPELNLLDPRTGAHETIATPGPLAFVAEGPDGALVLGAGRDVVRLDHAGSVTTVASVPDAPDGHRLNDARFDGGRRLWVGLMDEALAPGSGRLLRVDPYASDPDATWHEADRGFDLVNGLDWSADGRTLYVVESRKRRVYAYPFDPDAGALGERRTLVDLSGIEGVPPDGKPDGLVRDAHGHFLSPLFDGAAIARIAPDGTIERTIALPVPRPTSCVFGPDGRTLFVTSARLGLADDQLAAAPWSGSLLQLDYAEALQ